MSLAKEIEQLQNRRAELEQESHSLEEEQKNLEQRTKMLEERIAIQELNSGNKMKKEAISQLRSQMDELEQRLKGMPEEYRTPKPTDYTMPEVAKTPELETETLSEVAEPVQEESVEEEAVTVAALEEPLIAEQEELGEDLKRHTEKKKRKFF
jgi:uncharacterized coiled-coil protein SlyX